MDNIIFRDGHLYLIKSKGRRAGYDHLDDQICQFYSKHGFTLSTFSNGLINPRLINDAENVHVIDKDAGVIGIHVDHLYDIFAITQKLSGTKLRYNKVYLGNLSNKFNYMLTLNSFTKIAFVDKFETIGDDLCPDKIIESITSVTKNIRVTGDRLCVNYIDINSLCKHIDKVTVNMNSENIKHILSDWNYKHIYPNMCGLTKLRKEDLKVFNYLNVNF